MSLLFCPLFKDIPIVETETMLQQIESYTRTYFDGEIIGYQNDRYNELLIILNGRVKGEMFDISGKILKIEELKVGTPLAIAFLFSNYNVLPVNIIAVEETKILYLPKNSIVKLMQINSKFLNNFLQLISDKTQFLSQRILFLTFKNIRQKISYYLLENEQNGIVKIKLTQQELADYFGITRPSFARELYKMEVDKLIEIEKKIIKIIDKQKLFNVG